MKHLSIVGLLFLTTLSTGQQFGVNAPRSRSGIGDYFSNGYSRSRAMGISISSANKLFINNTNPALLPRTKYTTFEAGIENQYRALATSSAKQTSSDAIPAYFAISLPISKKWKSAVSLNPYTYANYSTAVTTETGTTTYSGSGGVNQFTFSNGVEATSNLSFGLNISYLFGKEKDNIATQVTDSSNYNLTRNESFYSGFQFKPGIAFRKELRKVTIPTRGKLVITNKNYRSKKDLIEICLDSLTVIDSLGKKERIALCKESVRLLDKKLIFEDTLTNQESFFAKKYIASVNKTTLNGNYFMLIPSYSEVIYDSEIPFSRKSKIKKYLKGINTKGYGVLVKASTLKGTEEEWSADLTKLLIDKKSTVSEDEKLTHTGDYLKRKSGIFFNAGLTYLLASKINNTFSTELDRLNVASNQLLFTDTLVNADTKKTTLPSELTVGFSLDKPTANGKKKNGTNRTATWSLGTEVSFLNGSNYVNPSPTRADDLVNGFRLGMGGEWVPNLNAKLKKEYFKRVFYRLGASYRKMPYLDNGQAVNDFGIQFGMGLPVGRYNLVTTFPKYVNLSFELGRRGDVSKGQIKENYFFTTLGFTINDKWFKRSKLGL